MEHSDFGEWLSEKSWQQGVRFCRVVAILIPVAAIAIDFPIIQSAEKLSQPVWQMMIAWHVIATLTALGIILVDKYAPQRWPRESMTNATAYLVLGLCAWFGIIGWLSVRDYSIYALGSVFVATVLCTPRHVRRPLYFATTFVICVVVFVNVPHDFETVSNAVTNPVCVAIVSYQLDKYAYERNVDLFKEMQRADAERQRADSVLYNVLPSSIADELKQKHMVNAAKFESMGVLFADIVGFTAYSRLLPPNALVVVLDEIFSRFDHLVDRHGVEKIKTIGDAYMAVSNKKTGDLAALALDMLDDIARYNEQSNTEFQLRIGIHVGPAVAGVVGVKRFLYDVWGDTVNVASRMESSGEPGKIHVSAAVHKQLAGAFVFESRGTIEVKGKGAMTTWFLVGRPAAAAAGPEPGVVATA